MTTAEQCQAKAQEFLDRALRAGDAARHASALGCFILAAKAAAERERCIEAAAQYESLADRLAAKP